jgi:tRNA-modifying protein YgfZ
MTTTPCLPLLDWGVIRARGADAASFLHGQLTQDISGLPPDTARLAGYCSPKGRLMATMVAWREGEDVLLALPAELLPATLKRLAMFVMRAQCKLTDASAELAVWGVMGASGPAWSLSREGESEGEAVQIALPAAAGQGRSLRVQPAGTPAPGPLCAAEDWAWAEVAAGLAWVRSATVEAFVPQMINLEALGGVNFQKGCYPGQEIVARSQYRGTIKRRLQLFEADGAATVGQEVFHSDDAGQPAGLVAAAATRDGRSLLAAEVKLAALDGGSLHLGHAGGPALLLRPLPYPIPAQD